MLVQNHVVVVRIGRDDSEDAHVAEWLKTRSEHIPEDEFDLFLCDGAVWKECRQVFEISSKED